MKKLSICVVLVTYNRLDKLKKALEAYDKLTKQPRKMIIVDNGSTDGTRKYLNIWQQNTSFFEKQVITLNRNTGGSGGFYEGIRQGCLTDCKWLWVADDDAYPSSDAFEKVEKYLEGDYAAICTQIQSQDGIDTWHRRRIRKGLLFIKEERIDEKEYSEVFELDLFSYVGTLLSVKAVKKAGLPEKEFFINYDDTEHSIRMVKEGKIICVPAAVVYHDSPGVTSDVLSWKKYYAVRNKLYTYKKHFGWKYGFLLRCYYLTKAILMTIKRHSIQEYLIVRKAIKDGNKGILGVDEKYCPGWKTVV